MSNFDNAVEIAQNNSDGTCICTLAPKVFILVTDYAETFVVQDHRAKAKRFEKFVSAEWAHKFLDRAFNVTMVGYSS